MSTVEERVEAFNRSWGVVEDVVIEAATASLSPCAQERRPVVRMIILEQGEVRDIREQVLAWLASPTWPAERIAAFVRASYATRPMARSMSNLMPGDLFVEQLLDDASLQTAQDFLTMLTDPERHLDLVAHIELREWLASRALPAPPPGLWVPLYPALLDHPDTTFELAKSALDIMVAFQGLHPHLVEVAHHWCDAGFVARGTAWRDGPNETDLLVTALHRRLVVGLECELQVRLHRALQRLYRPAADHHLERAGLLAWASGGELSVRLV